MKKNGKLYYAASTVNNEEYETLYFNRIDKDMFLVVIKRIFNSDPIKWYYSIRTEKQFRKAVKGMRLQEEV